MPSKNAMIKTGFVGIAVWLLVGFAEGSIPHMSWAMRLLQIVLAFIVGTTLAWFWIPVQGAGNLIKERCNHNRMLRAAELHKAGVYNDDEYQEVIGRLKSSRR